jgi:glycosyltransferase involved in cell wall biosynthesis
MILRCGCVIPVYRHFRELKELLPEVMEYFSPGSIVVVDDGSGEEADFIENSGIGYVAHPENRGKGAALITGMKELKKLGFTHALCMDADGQHSPEDIPAFLRNLGRADILIGNRMADLSSMPRERRLSNRITSALVRLKSGLPVADSQNGFRLVDIGAILDLKLSAGGFQFESEMLLKGGKAGLSLINIPVKTIYTGSFSAINHAADTWKFIKLLFR